MIALAKEKLLKLFNDARTGEVLRGATFTIVARGLAVPFGLISNVIIARYYGAEIMGIYALLGSFIAIPGLFSRLGTNVSLLRLIPEHIVKYSHFSAYNVYKKILLLVSIISILLGICLFFLSDYIANVVFAKDYLSPFLKICSIFLIFISHNQINMESLRAIKDINYYSIFQFFPTLITLVLISVLTFFFYDRYNPVYVFFMSIGIIWILNTYITRSLFKNKIDDKKAHEEIEYKEIFFLSFPMFLVSAMSLVMGQIDILMLTAMKTTEEVGIYSVAVKVSAMTAFILTAINTIAAPKFSELFHSGKMEDLFYVARTSSKLIFWTTVPILMIFILFGKWILWIFGEAFVPGYTALVLLTIGQFVNSAAGSVGYFLSMTGYQKFLQNIFVSSAIINVILNLLLIPLYSINGAAIASMISMSMWNIGSAVYIKRKFGRYISYVPGVV